MPLQSLIGFIAPRLIKYLLSNLSVWALPLTKGVAGHVEKNRLEIAQWIKDVVPGERFDELAVKAVDALIAIAMEEILKLAGVEAGSGSALDLGKIQEMVESTEVFDTIKDTVVNRVRTSVANF
jgi:hypothetical protein